MKRTISIALAAMALVGSSAIGADTADAATRISNSHLRNFCNAEKGRRGAANASIVNIVNRFNHWGQPDLKCLLAFRSRQAWLIAGAGEVCRFITGNSNWSRRGSSTVCRSNVNRRSFNMNYGRIRIPSRRNCRFIGLRVVCR